MQPLVQGKNNSDLAVNAQAFRSVWIWCVELVFWSGLALSWFL